MKLYFYILRISEHAEIKTAECEAVERKRTYKLLEYPVGFYNKTVPKEDIGTVLGWTRNVVILTEQNTEKAKEIFISRIEKEIERHKKEIIRYEKEIDEINSL